MPSVRPSKKASILALLQRPQGAAIGDLTEATGWQVHSVRAALTGLRKEGTELAAAGIRSKSWTSTTGRRWGGKPIARGRALPDAAEPDLPRRDRAQGAALPRPACAPPGSAYVRTAW